MGGCIVGIADPQTERAVRETHEEVERALIAGDSDSLERIMIEDALFVHIDGRVETKDELIARLRSGGRSLSRESEELLVRLYGESAILTGRSLIHTVVDGVEMHLDMRITRVFVRDGERWLFASNQSGANTANAADARAAR